VSQGFLKAIGEIANEFGGKIPHTKKDIQKIFGIVEK